MSGYVEVVRQGMALLLWFVAASIVVYFVLKSLHLAFRAARGEATFRTSERLPTKYAVSLAVAVILATVGMVLWAPELLSLVPCGFVAAVLVGLSAWLNLRIRQYFAQRRKPENNGDQ